MGVGNLRRTLSRLPARPSPTRLRAVADAPQQRPPSHWPAWRRRTLRCSACSTTVTAGTAYTAAGSNARRAMRHGSLPQHGVRSCGSSGSGRTGAHGSTRTGSGTATAAAGEDDTAGECRRSMAARSPDLSPTVQPTRLEASQFARTVGSTAALKRREDSIMVGEAQSRRHSTLRAEPSPGAATASWISATLAALNGWWTIGRHYRPERRYMRGTHSQGKTSVAAAR
jgi:hypothetical protein